MKRIGVLGGLSLGVACGGLQIRLQPMVAANSSAGKVTSAEYPDVDRVVLLDEAHISFVDRGQPSAGFTRTSLLRWRVLTPAGRRARITIFLSPWTELLSLGASSYPPQDPARATHLSKTGITIQAAAPQAGWLYSQARTVSFEIPGVDVGDVVEYRYTTRDRQSFLLSRWLFQTEDPVRTSRLTVDVPDGWRVDWGAWDGGDRMDLQPKRTPLAGYERLEFAQHDLPGRRLEPQMQPFASWTRRVEVKVAKGPGEAGWDYFESWEDIGRWYRRLAANNAVISDDHWRQVVAELDSEPTVEQLFAFVRDRTRYVVLYDDLLGAFQPHTAAEVLERQFGDCKDMATLLLALLARAGVEAHPMLVGIRDRVFFDPEFPSITAFNHVVVAVPEADGGYQFLDPTFKDAAYGVRQWHLDGQGALVVKPDGVEALRIPRPEKAYELDILYTVGGADRLTLEADLRGSAARGWAWMADHRPGDLDDRVSQFLSRVEVRSIDDVSVTRTAGAVRVEASATVGPLFRSAENRRILPLRQFLPNGVLKDPASDRVNDVHLGEKGQLRIRVRLPATMSRRVIHRPPSVEVVEGGLRFRFKSTESDGVVEASFALDIERRTIPQSELNVLRAFDARLAEAARAAFVLSGGRR